MHLIDSGGLYGAESVLLELMTEQQKLGVETVLLSIGVPDCPPKDVEIAAEKKNLPVRTVRIKKGLNIKGLFSIIKTGEQCGIDIFHSHAYKTNILLGMLPKFIRKKPVISTIHGWTATQIMSKKGIIRLLDLLCLKNLDRTVVVSPVMLNNKFIKCMRLQPVMIRNGISTLHFDDRDVDEDQLFHSFCKDAFVIGTIGRLSKEKGYHFLIDALKMTTEKYPNIRLVIIGEGPERERLTTQIAALQLEEHVLLPGFIPQAYQYMRFFDLFVLSSLTEGLPITLLEAMQAGLPIVATEVGGVGEVLGNGEYGMLIEPAKATALSSALLSLYTQPDHRDDLCAAVRNRAVDYSVGRMTSEYLSLYKELCDAV